MFRSGGSRDTRLSDGGNVIELHVVVAVTLSELDIIHQYSVFQCWAHRFARMRAYALSSFRGALCGAHAFRQTLRLSFA